MDRQNRCANQRREADLRAKERAAGGGGPARLPTAPKVLSAREKALMFAK
eukprot:CAMPEP_0182853272 /NCGR_PEP_ID=MMETSP0034_2-20130328/612_1 /TAXON_ID=156128 /ORGANISM="Nephroselmis pyriformis, Strain CCMP717" /LENGTH=49 /DNA_ID= /DNA_START= /DNA_END= /DNA_ORIENTATION=